MKDEGEREWEKGRGDVIYVYDKEEREEMREEYGINKEEKMEEESGIEFRRGKEINEEGLKREILEGVKEISIEDL